MKVLLLGEDSTGKEQPRNHWHRSGAERGRKFSAGCQKSQETPWWEGTVKDRDSLGHRHCRETALSSSHKRQGNMVIFFFFLKKSPQEISYI